MDTPQQEIFSKGAPSISPDHKQRQWTEECDELNSAFQTGETKEGTKIEESRNHKLVSS